MVPNLLVRVAVNLDLVGHRTCGQVFDGKHDLPDKVKIPFHVRCLSLGGQRCDASARGVSRPLEAWGWAPPFFAPFIFKFELKGRIG